MSAQHSHERADNAARKVDPLMMAMALDHIARTAARSHSQTRRIRWIEHRAVGALEGREYRDIDIDLPRNAGPDTVEKLGGKVKRLKRLNADLVEALQLIVQWDEAGLALCDHHLATARAALASVAAQQATEQRQTVACDQTQEAAR